ncbi:MAG: hypothetical protein Q4G24_08615 [Paracoccus sp. (in: a-proteobacteria)]|uniref:hypothetical protein n=1 Tax=Paracoccus sp. TaxID=267 RepID=UPI0026E08493|nr:hypothetical protein [Paracoccus sp. (in: a-proteobacteria)]MDO5621516.1 hypothetical protein [Paracoccus sp. (in: a-proteobacteria)]
MKTLLLLIGTLALVGCTETVTPAGVTAVSATDLKPVAYDEVAEARLLTNACVRAEMQGAGTLASLTQQGYSYAETWSDASYVKMGLPGKGLARVHRMAVNKQNDRLNCTIQVMPYTHGAAVLAVATDELQRQGWSKVPTERGRADWFRKDGQTLSVSGWVPGQNRHLITGAEVIISRITK